MNWRLNGWRWPSAFLPSIRLREASHLSLMNAYADSGERSMALQHYSICRDLLKSELKIQPGQESNSSAYD